MNIKLSNKYHSQSGSVLVLVVVVTGLIGFTLASYLTLVKSQNQATMRSQAWNSSIPVIEAGIEDALTHLNEHADTGLETDGWNKDGDVYHIKRSIGDAYYIVTISNYFGPGSTSPIIASRGYVTMPAQVVSSDQTMFAQAGGGIPAGTLGRGVQVTAGLDALFAKGLVAKGQIDLNGNNIDTDSFDSTNPLYSTGGQYDPTKARDKGDVATNSGLVNSLNVGNANIKGKVSTGPGGSVSIGPNGVVGSSGWHSGGNSGIESGWSSDDMNVDFPDVEAPFSGGAWTPAPGVVDSTAYTYVLGTGNYQLNSLNMSGTIQMIVTGDAVLYVTGNTSITGGASITIAPGASLKFYQGGASANLGGNGVINQNAYAANFIYRGLPANTSLSMSGNAQMTGIIYAPEAALTLNGGGGGGTDFIGASISKTATLNGHFKFHYDESLANLGPSRGYVVTTWNEMTPDEVANFDLYSEYFGEEN